MAEKTGLKSFWWLNAALQGFSAIFFIFLFPETRFKRRSVLKKSPACPPIPNNEVCKVEQVEANNVSPLAESSDPEKAGPSRVQGLDPAVDYDNLASTPSSDEDPWLGRGKPSRSQWRLFQPYEGNFLLEIWLPWKIYLYPIVQFAAMVVAWSCSSSLTLNLTQSQVYAAAPYNFTSSKIGLFNVAIFVGVLIGLFTAGPLSDLVAKWLTKRNNGVREPEMRLPAMIPYIIFMIIGNIIAALAYQHHWDWKVCSRVRPLSISLIYRSRVSKFSRLPLLLATPVLESSLLLSHQLRPPTRLTRTSQLQVLYLSPSPSTRTSGHMDCRNI